MKHSMATLYTSALVGLALAAPAFAQGGFGGPGGFQRPAFGTVSAVDTTANTITVSGRNGQDQVINIGANTQMVTQTSETVADLKVGDQIAVQGIPTGITASQVTVGQPPAGLPGGGGPGGPGGFGGPPPGGPGGAAPMSQGFAMATGTIKTLPTTADPHLSLALGQDAVLFIKMAPTATVTKYTTVALANIKSGDRIFARGSTGADGTMTADVVGVNLPMGNFGGFGGPGGFRGGRRGGFGGPGGGGPGGNFGGPPPPGQ